MRTGVKKVLLTALCAILLLAAVVFAAAYLMFRDKLQAADTVEWLGPLTQAGQPVAEQTHGIYVMEYPGDYGFEAFLAQGGAASSEDMAEYIVGFLSNGFYHGSAQASDPSGFRCSTLSAADTGGAQLFGRNYDWEPCDAMVVHTMPDSGYESYSTVCLDFLGFGADWKPEGLANRYMALAAVYVPLDGMNEKGLCVADLMAGDREETHQQTDKPDLTTTACIRLLLDHAATVDEAVALLTQYDMNSDIGMAHHLSISDAAGNSVVVEYIGGKMYVTDTAVVTNHYLTPGSRFGTGSEQSLLRYDALIRQLADRQGVMTPEEMQTSLAAVAQSNFPGEDEITVWSIVYDQTELTLDYYFGEAFEQPYRFTIGAFQLSGQGE